MSSMFLAARGRSASSCFNLTMLDSIQVHHVLETIVARKLTGDEKLDPLLEREVKG